MSKEKSLFEEYDELKTEHEKLKANFAELMSLYSKLFTIKDIPCKEYKIMQSADIEGKTVVAFYYELSKEEVAKLDDMFATPLHPKFKYPSKEEL